MSGDGCDTQDMLHAALRERQATPHRKTFYPGTPPPRPSPDLGASGREGRVKYSSVRPAGLPIEGANPRSARSRPITQVRVAEWQTR